MSNITLPMTPQELEALVRRVVREEITRVLRRSYTVSGDYRQEGPDNPEEDQILLKEAQAVLHQIADNPEAWTDWEDFEAELDSAEAGGELPD
jgi:hypothetical protein